MAKALTDFMIPEDLEVYMSFYGRHFNKRLCEWAVGNMEREDKATGMMKKITPMRMEELQELLKKYKVEIDSNSVYDALYLANMVKADMWGSSIEDEQHLALHVKDVLCDPDGYDGVVFNRFRADCDGKGIVLFWDKFVNDAW